MMQATQTKEITTTNHPDGRKDVHIQVNRLDVNPQDKAGIVAKEAIEKTVFTRLSEQKVLVIVLHKPTNQEAHHVVDLPHVRAFAEAAVRKFLKLNNDEELTQDAVEDFAVIENNLSQQTVKVTTL